MDNPSLALPGGEEERDEMKLAMRTFFDEGVRAPFNAAPVPEILSC